MSHVHVIQKIVSGGQTGVDRGALDAAMALAIAHGGWCPRGRRAEDGTIPPCYLLKETESRRYSARTEQNVIDADATLILCNGKPVGGTALTVRLAQKHARPYRIDSLSDGSDPDEVRHWIETCQCRVLNVAGPRESTLPGAREKTYRFLLAVLRGPTE
jgi:hypothetical protein